MAIERIVPNSPTWHKYYGNHISRYNFAKNLIPNSPNLKILDAATGVGYGAHYLSDIPGSFITGIDISDEALKIAESHFAKKNISFIKDSCLEFNNIPKDERFDYIISFETFEHLKNPEIFLKKSKDLLKEKGTLIISTPNVLVTENYTKSDWEFHEKEYTPKEFEMILKENGFNNYILYGQNYTPIGLLKDEIRHELGVLLSNPFVRLGILLQKTIRRKNIFPPLPEKIEDFEIVKSTAPEMQAMGKQGPFVLIAVISAD